MESFNGKIQSDDKKTNDFRREIFRRRLIEAARANNSSLIKLGLFENGEFYRVNTLSGHHSTKNKAHRFDLRPSKKESR